MGAMEMPRELVPLFVHGICLGMDSCLTASSLPKSAGLKAKRAHEQVESMEFSDAINKLFHL